MGNTSESQSLTRPRLKVRAVVKFAKNRIKTASKGRKCIGAVAKLS